MSDNGVLAMLSAAGFPVYLRGFSAIDVYVGGGKKNGGGNAVLALVMADIADLAKLFEGLRYPGADLADAALETGDTVWYFRCVNAELSAAFPCEENRPPFKLLEFYQNGGTGRFCDPQENYPLLRAILGKPVLSGGEQGSIAPAIPWWKNLNPGAERCRALACAALILVKYFPQTSNSEIKKMASLFCALPDSPPPGIEEQRLLLAELLSAPNPAPGFELLKSGGFIGEFWQELAVLDDVDQSKEFHPEGNAWKHTLETLRYRKTAGTGGNVGGDLLLSLGLLLHDVGKPIAASSGSRRFDGHAELGEWQSRRFLERLKFPAPLVNDVCYLVRNHMLPAALPRLPLARTGEIMSSPLFPALLELYRCDESSSFKGLDGYYESSAAYQSYLKNRRNPYRSADGKKLGRAQMQAGVGCL